MDPEANYEHQRRIYERAKAGESLPHDKAMLRELIAAMRGWIAAGGFRPRGYVGPAWKPVKAPAKSEGQKRGERRYADAKRRLTVKLGRAPTTGEMARNVADRMQK